MCGGVERESQTWKAEVDERALSFPLANCLDPAHRIMPKAASMFFTRQKSLAHVGKIDFMLVKAFIVICSPVQPVRMSRGGYDQKCAMVCGRSPVMRHTTCWSTRKAADLTHACNPSMQRFPSPMRHALE
jgi:hypothetical protein